MSKHFLAQAPNDLIRLIIGGVILVIFILAIYDEFYSLQSQQKDSPCIDCSNEVNQEDEKLCRIFYEYWGKKPCSD